MENTVVIGLGNPLLGDEGVGIAVVRALAERHAQVSNVAFFDLGTAGMRILHLLGEYQKAMLVDCALMGEEPGVIRRFALEELHSPQRLPGLSLHEGNLVDILKLAVLVNEAPPTVTVFGIEPADLAPRLGLSPWLASRFPHYLNVISAEITGSADRVA